MTTSICTHPAIFKNLCVSCGKNIKNISFETGNINSENSGWTNKITFKGGHTLELSKTEASQVQNYKANALRNSKKLALILDLDNTLIHASSSLPNLSAHDIHYIELQSNSTILPYWIKLRPNIHIFLKEIHQLYQLFIYTHGTRDYAQKIANILDPENKYFGQRILSRTDVPELGSSKSLHRLFLDDMSMAVIMDDRQDVWKGKLKI